MKTTRWTPWSIYSKAGSKRNRYLLVLILLAAGTIAEAQDILLQDIRFNPGSIGVDLQLSGIDPDPLLDNLFKGLSASVTFRIRLCRKNYGIFSILGDMVIDSVEISRRAYWDEIDQAYYIKEGNDRRPYLHKDAFLADFFSLKGSEIPFENRDSKYYLQVKGELNPALLAAPLVILAPILEDQSVETRWTDIPLQEWVPE